MLLRLLLNTQAAIFGHTIKTLLSKVISSATLSIFEPLAVVQLTVQLFITHI